MKFIQRLLPLFIIFIGMAVSATIYLNKPPAKRRHVPPKVLSVEAITVRPQEHSLKIETQGVVEPRTTTTLIPRVAGEIVNVVANFRPGGFFEAGDLLLAIDPIDYRLDIKAAQAAVAEALFVYQEEQAQAKQAEENWHRLGRTTTPSDLLLRKPQLARAKAAVDSAKAQLQRAELNLQRTQIKAPYSGRMLEQFVDIGQYVSPGTPLAKIFAIDYVEIRLPLSEKQRQMIAMPWSYRGESDPIEGPAATIYADIGGQTYHWKSKIVRSEGSIDRSTRQIVVIAQVNNPYQHRSDTVPPLEIGQFVRASIQGRVLKNVYAIPRTALQGGDTVMIVDSSRHLHRKKIDVLWETQQHVLVENLLQPGERLCVTYIPFAADNTLVNVIGDHKSNTKELTQSKLSYSQHDKNN